jgi:HSP20 family molecular chaperone IbpA
VDADRIRAELENGVLTVELPKPPELHAKKIDVKAT